MLPYDNTERHDMGYFAKPFMAAIIGGYIGAKLDQTTFGQWVNTNPVIDRLCYLLKLGFLMMVVAAVMLYVWILLNQN